jgi:hypothetical protein
MTTNTAPQKTTIEIEYETLSGGKKTASLIPLKRKESAEVFHNTLLKMLNSGGEIEGIIKGLDFESLWNLASKVLRGAVIDRHHEIRNLEDTDYFENHPDELMLLTLQGITANWPNFFRPSENISADSEK